MERNNLNPAIEKIEMRIEWGKISFVDTKVEANENYFIIWAILFLPACLWKKTASLKFQLSLSTHFLSYLCPDLILFPSAFQTDGFVREK